MTCQRHVNFLNFERVHGRINGVTKKAAKVKAIHGFCLVVRETWSRRATVFSYRLQSGRKTSNTGYSRDEVRILIRSLKVGVIIMDEHQPHTFFF